jgi:hypothetical protein
LDIWLQSRDYSTVEPEETFAQVTKGSQNNKHCTNKYFAIDIYGSGPDQKDITQAFHGRRKPGEEANGGTTGHANGSSRMSIMRTALSLGGGTTDASSSNESTSSDESAANDGDYEGSDSTYDIAKQRLKKIKKTINAVELPKAFSELRRQPIHSSDISRPHRSRTALWQNSTAYSVFINPSLSEVLCTTTAEALGHGQVCHYPVAVASHPTLLYVLSPIS